MTMIQSLDALFNPRRLALVGASDSNIFARTAVANAMSFMAAGDFALVNARLSEVAGRVTVATCQEIEGGIDAAILLSSYKRARIDLDDAATAGAKAVVVLSQGWGEAGEEGIHRQAELVAAAKDHGIALLGPNSLGCANTGMGRAMAAFAGIPPTPGPIALLSQSGALANGILSYAGTRGVGFSLIATTGNEAMVTLSDLLAYAVEHEQTKAIAMFAETIRDPATFLAATQRAADLGKAVVIVKAGSSEIAARTAASHTGAVVGDDRVIDAVFGQHGVIRVDSLEDLVVTAQLAARSGALSAPGFAAVSISGGACDLIADRAHDEGLRIALPSAASVAAMEATLPDGVPHLNPMDVTGAALADATIWERAMTALAVDGGIGLMGVVVRTPRTADEPMSPSLQAIGRASRALGETTVFLCPQSEQTIDEETLGKLAAEGIDLVLPSVDRAVTAAAKVQWWSRWRANQRRATAEILPAVRAAAHDRPEGEVGARGLLELAGVPVVPAVLVQDADSARRAAERFGGRVVLKIASRDIAHKSDIGGVKVGVPTDSVEAAFAAVMAAGKSLDPVPRIDGVLVSPMRPPGIEMIVGVVRDPSWGPVLAVGLGGIFVEVLSDTVLRVLPVTADDVSGMLNELRAVKVLDGFRGAEPADREALVSTILAISQMAGSLGPDLVSFEVNPVRVYSAGAESLDALVEWA